HLTVGGCLGPCALANVALLLFEGRALWFHSIDSAATVYALYEYVEQLLDTDASAPVPEYLASNQFTASAWQGRPDGQVVDDYRPRRLADAGPAESPAETVSDACHPSGAVPAEANRIVADMPGAAAAPRRNGELVFETPWQGRAFGMAVALHQQALYPWDDFRDRLVAQIARADAERDPSGYYERWLAAFERLLSERGVVSPDELNERTYEFEFGERDDVY
ncbi:MAG: nitrile hydratase accessory protein, partial [Dehalococcoidia bacterium]